MTGCVKRRYGSRKAVLAANRTNGKRVRAYFCGVCHGWHATTKPVLRKRWPKPNIEAEAA